MDDHHRTNWFNLWRTFGFPISSSWDNCGLMVLYWYQTILGDKMNTIIADLSYGVENVERLNELLEFDKSQIEVALGILRANRIKLMAILEEQTN